MTWHFLMMRHFFIKKFQNRIQFSKLSKNRIPNPNCRRLQILKKTKFSKRQNQNSILKAFNLHRPPTKKMLNFCNRIGINEKGGLHHLLSYILITNILIKRLFFFFKISKGHAAQRTTNLYRKTILIHRPMLKLSMRLAPN